MQEKTTITIIDTIGTPNAILHSFGMKIFDTAKSVIQENRPVVIDFNGVRNLTSAFLHASVGNLVTLAQNSGNLVTWKGLENPSWEERVLDAVNLAKNPEKKRAIEVELDNLFDA